MAPGALLIRLIFYRPPCWRVEQKQWHHPGFCGCLGLWLAAIVLSLVRLGFQDDHITRLQNQIGSFGPFVIDT